MTEKERIYDETIERFLDGKATMAEVYAADPYQEARQAVAKAMAESYYKQKQLSGNSG